MPLFVKGMQTCEKLRSTIQTVVNNNAIELLRLQERENMEIVGEVVCDPVFKRDKWDVHMETCHDEEAGVYSSRPKCKGERKCQNKRSAPANMRVV